VKKIILSGLLITIILLTASSCEFNETQGDCDENSEDAYVSNLGTLPTGSSPVHANDGPEFCNPMHVNCTSCTSDSGCSCDSSEYGIYYNCTCNYGTNCEGCTVVFEENCNRSEHVDDNGLLCGTYRKPEANKAGTNIHEDGFMIRANWGFNQFAQCFVARHLDATGGDPTTLSLYFPLGLPEITINTRRCDGVPEGTTYKYTTNGLTIEMDNQYAADCMACPSMVIKINGVAYNLRNDPYCGRDVPGSGWNGNYCNAGAHNTTTTTTS